MRKLLTLLALFALAEMNSFASTTCVAPNLAVLIGSSCTWTTSSGAVLTFNNFTLITNDDGLGGQVPPANWLVSYIDGGSTFRITLAPSSPITETAPSSGQGALYQFLMLYNVSDVLGPGGAGAINQEVAGLTGSAVPNGQVQFVKSVRTPTGAVLASPSDLIITTPTNTQTSSATFAPQTAITVLDSVNVNSGNLSGASATLNSFYNQVGVAAIPEPGSYTYVLVGLAFCIVGITGRRRKTKA